MKFILWLDPDTQTVQQHLDFAFDAMSNAPLAWTVESDDGTSRVDVTYDATQRFAPDPHSKQWLAYPRAETPPTSVQFSDDDQQLDWLLRAVTAAGADVNQRRYDLESIAAIIARNPQAGYGRMPIDTDVHGPDCIVCRGVEDFTLDPPGLSRDGHPYVDMDADENKGKLLVETPRGTFYVGPLEKGVAVGHAERFVAEGSTIRDGQTVYVVHLADDESPDIDDTANVAEFGVSSRNDREEAWRYVLGAMFGPIDAEYDEGALHEALDRGIINVKPEFEYLMTAVLHTWSGSSREDFDLPGTGEYLRGQVELLIEAGAVNSPRDWDSDDVKSWLTSHIITRVILDNVTEN